MTFAKVQRGTTLSPVTLAALACVAAASACGNAPVDTPPDVGELPLLAHVEEVRIGSATDPDSGFSRIRRVRVSESGDVFVLDLTAKQVRVFANDGRLLRVIGGPGAGPGEFGVPTDLGLIGDTLWVHDVAQRRITWFGPEGDVLFTLPYTAAPIEIGVRGVRASLVPARPRPDGLIESDISIFVMQARAIRPYRYPVVLFDRTGEVVDTLRWETADEAPVTYRTSKGQGYAPTFAPVRPLEIGPSDDRTIVDWSAEPGSAEGALTVSRIEAHDTAYTLTLRYEPIPVPGHVLDSLIAPRIQVASMLGESEAELESALRDAIQLPAFRPPIRVARVDADGTVWLRLNTSAADGLADWLLIEADGTPRGRLRLPQRMDIHHAALPDVWAVELDEVDVPWLVRLRVE